MHGFRTFVRIAPGLVAFVLVLALLVAPAPVRADVQSMNLVSGFNFVGLTVSVPGLTSRTVLSQNPSVVGIYRYDQTTRKYASQLNLGGGDFDGADFALVPGEGYILRATATTTLPVAGTAVSSVNPLSLQAGFAIVAFPAGATTSHALMQGNATIVGVYRFDPAAKKYVSELNLGGGDFDGASFDLVPGIAYVVRATVATTLDLATLAGATTLSGTAATGKPLANAAVAVKDRNGTPLSATTDALGKYTASVVGLSPPFLVRVAAPTGGALYTVAHRAGIANATPLTHLIVGTWYRAQSRDVAADFDALSPATPVPTALQVKTISTLVKDVVEKWLVDAQVQNASSFDLFTTPFAADDTGFDRVLAATTVSSDGLTITIRDDPTNPTITQTSSLTVDAATSTLGVSTVITAGTNETSTNAATVVVTTSSTEETDLQGIATLLQQIAATLNGSATIAAADLLPYLDAGYLHDGLDAAAAAAKFASEHGGYLYLLNLDRVLAYDRATNVIRISDLGIFRRQSDGSWRLYGNQRPGRIHVALEMLTVLDSTGVYGPKKHVNVEARARKGTVASVTVTGGGVFQASAVPKSSSIWLEDGIEWDAFVSGADLDTFPPAGTAFTVTLNPVSGAPASTVVVTSGTTTESHAITSPTGRTLADAKLGQPVTFSWTLPKTFAVKNIDFGGLVSSTHQGEQGFSSWIPGLDVAPTATSGTVTFPTTVNGQPVVEVLVNVAVNGFHGERALVVDVLGR